MPLTITDITKEMFPLLRIATKENTTYSSQFFRDATEAEGHRKLLIEQLSSIETALRPTFTINPAVGDGSLKVTEYTTEQWREDLIKAVMQDSDAMRRALNVLRNEMLIDLLK